VKKLYFIIRILFLFIPPLVLSFIVYNIFSFNFLLNPVIEQGQVVSSEDLVIEKTESLEQKFEFLLPKTINPKWFLYRVNLENNVKMAIVGNAGEVEPPYSEHDTNLVVATKKGNIEISYKKKKEVVSNVKKEEILDNIIGYRFTVDPEIKIVVGPSKIVKLEHSPSLGMVNVSGELTSLFKWIIFLSFFASWGGLIIWVRSLFQFIFFGKRWWFKI